MPLYFPKIYEEETSRTKTDLFYGLNHGARIGDGEWADMLNMTSDELPVAAVRSKREVSANGRDGEIYIMATNPTENGVYVPIILTEDGYLRIAGTRVDLNGFGFDQTKKHKLVQIGAYVVVFPEIIYYNISNVSDRGSASEGTTYKTREGYTSYIKAIVCDVDGNEPKYKQYNTPGVMDDSEPVNGDLWHRTVTEDEDSPALFRFDDEHPNRWYPITSYLKINYLLVNEVNYEGTASWYFPNGGIRVGDYIRLSGEALIGNTTLNKAHYVHNLDYVAGSKNNTTIWYLIVEGITRNADGIKLVMSDEKPLKMNHEIPVMDNIIEAGNRLWGVRYGKNNDALFVNEIYCSARGDFFRWIGGPADNDDSPVTFSIGAEGSWSGAINYGGVPTFFKENNIFRIYGAGASGFNIAESAERGVMIGAEDSIAYIDGSLYYYNKSGVMRYDGTVPVNVSEKIGAIKNVGQVKAGTCNQKYYINIILQGDKNHNGTMYVLDTRRGVWTKENGIYIVSNMETVGDNLYFVGPSGLVSILPYERYKYADQNWEPEKTISWYAETGILGLENPDDKYLSKISLRVHLEPGAVMRVLVQYNSLGEWKQIGATNKSTMGTVTLTVLPVKCDHLRLRLEGEGDCKIFSITKTFERAGDR